VRFVCWDFELVADVVFRGRSLVACVGYTWITHLVDIPSASTVVGCEGPTVVLEVSGRGRDRFVRWNIWSACKLLFVCARRRRRRRRTRATIDAMTVCRMQEQIQKPCLADQADRGNARHAVKIPSTSQVLLGCSLAR